MPLSSLSKKALFVAKAGEFTQHTTGVSDYTAGEGQRLGAEPLAAFFARTPRLAIALSGGCDSAYLLAAACAAGCEVFAYGIKTAFQPDFSLDDAKRLARDLGVPFRVFDINIFDHADICENTDARCYLCKQMMFETIVAAARADGFDVVADGTNATDDPTNRPGFQALAEWGIVSPLRRGALTKDDIRHASRELGLFTADMPSFSCYAVHAPAHQRLDAAVIAQVRQRFEH